MSDDDKPPFFRGVVEKSVDEAQGHSDDDDIVDDRNSSLVRMLQKVINIIRLITR